MLSNAMWDNTTAGSESDRAVLQVRIFCLHKSLHTDICVQLYHRSRSWRPVLTLFLWRNYYHATGKRKKNPWKLFPVGRVTSQISTWTVWYSAFAVNDISRRYHVREYYYLVESSHHRESTYVFIIIINNIISDM